MKKAAVRMADGLFVVVDLRACQMPDAGEPKELRQWRKATVVAEALAKEDGKDA